MNYLNSRKPLYLTLAALYLTMGLFLVGGIGWLTPREAGVALVMAGLVMIRLHWLYAREHYDNPRNFLRR